MADMDQRVEQRRENLEENAMVLDFLPTGRSSSARSEPVVQMVGEEKFTLLEAVPKTPDIKIGEKVYIGKGERDKIAIIKGRLLYTDLTEVARSELLVAVSGIIKANEAKFVGIFNVAGPLNIRMHSLELLPGIGKKHLTAILDARDEKQFESFADIAKRVPLLQDPVKLLAERVILELKGESRFYILTKFPAREHNTY
jgi:putative nucleotide binding protein